MQSAECHSRPQLASYQTFCYATGSVLLQVADHHAQALLISASQSCLLSWAASCSFSCINRVRLCRQLATVFRMEPLCPGHRSSSSSIMTWKILSVFYKSRRLRTSVPSTPTLRCSVASTATSSANHQQLCVLMRACRHLLTWTELP